MTQDNDRLLIFDGHNVALRAYHALSKQTELLRNKDGDGTWGIYGFFTTLTHFVNRLNPNKVVITFDWGQSEKRLLLLPEYKGNRKFNNSEEVAKRQESRRQVEVLIRLLEIFNIKVLREPNVEADDIIAKIVKQNDCEIVIVSGDHDLRQLVNDKVIVVKPSIGIKEEDIYDYKKVVETYGIEPHMLPKVWALTGDTSDNIPGIPGVGEKTAVEWIKKYGSLENVLASGEEKLNFKRFSVDTAYRLINLDGSYCELKITDLKFDPIQPGQHGAGQVLAMLDALDFNSIKQKWIVGELWSGNELSVGKPFKAK
jgi:DNA polymerase-1